MSIETNKGIFSLLGITIGLLGTITLGYVGWTTASIGTINKENYTQNEDIAVVETIVSNVEGDISEIKTDLKEVGKDVNKILRALNIE